MDKILTLVGRKVSFSASDDDHYLATMSTEGPVDLMPVFEAFCKAGGYVVDVGANIGVTAILAGVLVAPGSVLAVEPVVEAFEYLRTNVERSGLTNVKCLNVAAASRAGSVTLMVHPGWNFGAFVGYEDVLDRYPQYAEFPIAAMTLDQIIGTEQPSRIDFIKIDVEGYELEVLRGAKQLLETYQPVVFLEVNHYCLNIFRRMSLVDFTDEILSLFPHVFAVDTSFTTLDLTTRSNHQHFFHENVVSERFPNLLCGFTSAVSEGVETLQARAREVTREQEALVVDLESANPPARTHPTDSWRRRLGRLMDHRGSPR